ncbi:MAG TPA: formylmethanofuran dehydrogenase subunit C [Gemmatales bacterium]|nr:formylmethanofuran dehydrogenase subunit C [Gemmatales bacterium]
MTMLFRWKGSHPPVGTIDGSVLRPDWLASLKVAELKQQRITIGRHDYAWSDVYEIEGDPCLTWTLPGAANYLHLATGMSSGLLRIDGAAGDFAGQQMQGGCMEIHGSAGHSLGAGMQGGLITVTGDAGPQVGGPCHDAHVGMTDGEIIIQGSAGPRAGFRKRRGLIVAQRCEEQAGNHMLAGTIVVFKGQLHKPGLSMKRGTILCIDPNSEITWLPYFQPDCVYRPVFVQIMLGRLMTLGCKLADGARHGKYQLYSGDRLSNGKAEILQWQP